MRTPAVLITASAGTARSAPLAQPTVVPHSRTTIAGQGRGDHARRVAACPSPRHWSGSTSIVRTSLEDGRALVGTTERRYGRSIPGAERGQRAPAPRQGQDSSVQGQGSEGTPRGVRPGPPAGHAGSSGGSVIRSPHRAPSKSGRSAVRATVTRSAWRRAVTRGRTRANSPTRTLSIFVLNGSCYRRLH